MSLYSGMGRAMNKVVAGYSDAQLAVIADFLHKTVDAGEHATEDLDAR
jgi:hypothetical protein